MQRLYVGGLSHTVTQKDLKDRFGKFGDVEEVELRIRKDSEGVPYKTFGYINISISDANLKKCLTVLNKSKWKGGTLRIEVAKESFLHRLAEERQTTAEQALKHSAAEDRRQEMLDSLRGAGVENFTMRSAVPGSEVPGHKNWVVSKFGRVLPILQLSHRRGIKVRSMKYDPSKYSHNIRRLDQSSPESATPVTRLTWELQGGDSDISKKRRGEFPPFHPVGPKRSCMDKTNDHNHAKTRPNQPMAGVTDSVVDEVDEDDFEEVGLDYVLKSRCSSLQEDDEDESDQESSCYSSDSEYDAMFSNAPLVKISLADLQRFSEESQKTPQKAAGSSLSLDEESRAKAKRVPQEGTTPEQILASILEDFRKDELKQKKKTCVKTALPPFQGTRALREEEEGRGAGKKTQKLDSDVDEEIDASGALEAVPDKPGDGALPAQERDRAKDPEQPFHSQALSTEEEEEEEQQLVFKRKEDVEQQRKDNLRRLAAIQQRQKETEEHKKVIQSALAQLDASTPAPAKHIIFDSDEEDESGAAASEGSASKRMMLEDGSQSEDETSAGTKEVKPSAPQLFAGTDEEEDEDDGGRFAVKPQFEGLAGQKLMGLQSRFGTDERFRIDARFLEDGEDEEEKNETVIEGATALEEERKKNLSILQSVLGGRQHSNSATAGKAKNFRDVSALHYDPTREEHTALETRTTATKESKAARRKKREEAEKLPEVSKEIYYDVSCNLKAAFSQKNDGKPEKAEQKSWDQHVEAEEEERSESCHPAAASVAGGEASGFHFSFFGDQEDAGGPGADYRAESISASRLPWQRPPQLKDSSSEEEEEGEEEQRHPGAPAKEETLQTEMFFFVQEDSRLTEGPRLFCCSSYLEEQKEQWEERRSSLRSEYRKKHKEARRKLRNLKKS